MERFSALPSEHVPEVSQVQQFLNPDDFQIRIFLLHWYCLKQNIMAIDNAYHKDPAIGHTLPKIGLVTNDTYDEQFIRVTECLQK